MRRWMAALLAVLLMLTPLAATTEEEGHTARPYAEPLDGTILVMLSSLGTRTALGMTIAGAYSVGGDRGFQFDPGTEIAIGLEGESILLKVGGATIDMGSSFTLERHLDTENNAGGVYIHESEKDTQYCGNLTFSVRDGSLRVVVALNIEDYLYGVVPYEMSDTFPLEALKAQAVAARTYAMQRKTRKAGDEYHVVDTANDQVYKGLDARFEKPIQAVDETRGIVGMHNDRFAECFYSASNGGQTALATDVWGNEGDFAYLDMRDDPYDLENPESIVKSAVVSKDPMEMKEALYTMIVEEVAKQLQATGELKEGEAVGLAELVNVEAVNPVYGGDSRQFGTIRFTVKASVRRYLEETGGIRMLGEQEVLDTALSVDLSLYDQVRSALGIGINSSKYELVTVTPVEDGFKLITRRFGHGVGLSQRGAQWMAGKYEMDYLDILGFYYPGLEMVQITWMEPELTPAHALPESLGYAAPRPTPAPTPAPLPPLAAGEYYAYVTVEGVDATLNVRAQPSREGRLVGMLRNEARLIVMEETEDGWAKMKTAELEGYVSVNYIVME